MQFTTAEPETNSRPPLKIVPGWPTTWTLGSDLWSQLVTEVHCSFFRKAGIMPLRQQDTGNRISTEATSYLQHLDQVLMKRLSCTLPAFKIRTCFASSIGTCLLISLLSNLSSTRINKYFDKQLPVSIQDRIKVHYSLNAKKTELQYK